MGRPESRAPQVRVEDPLAGFAASYKVKLEQSGYASTSVATSGWRTGEWAWRAWTAK